MLAGKTVAIVGNGPSGNGQGASIDGCDFVVRMNMWKTYGPINSGGKVSAILGHAAYCTTIPDELKENRDWELWCSYPTDVVNMNPGFESPSDCVDWKWLLQTANGRIIRTISRESSKNICAALLATGAAPGIFPTAGLACIAMVLDRGPKQLHLWGFDRVDNSVSKPENSWGQVKLTPQTSGISMMHDFGTEKKILAELVDRKLWGGKIVEPPVFWHGRPGSIPK